MKKFFATLLIVQILTGSPFLVAMAEESADTTSATEVISEVQATSSDLTDTMTTPTSTDQMEPSLTALEDTPALTDSPTLTTPDTTVATDTPEATLDMATSTQSEIPPLDIQNTFTINERFATTTGGAEASLATTTTATTGEAVVIKTGDAVAVANILNMLNTNFINSEGSVQFANFYDYINETLNFNTPPTASACPNLPCTIGNDLTVTTTSDGIARNTVDLLANSGNNTIANSTSAVIETGDAYAGLNLVNLVNTNVVDSTYLIVTINAFNGVGSDIIFPSLLPTLTKLSKNGSLSGVSIMNGATSTTDLIQSAETGNNDSGSNGVTSTGRAVNATNVLNKINSTSAGGYDVSFIFKVSGVWAGTIFGLPDDYSWLEESDGSIVIFNQDAGIVSRVNDHSLDTVSNDRATIENSISVIALTGENQISGAKSSSIVTGDAYAGTNIVNVANSTVIGKNWIVAIINIFGDFLGNISFGQPNLWVGAIVDTPPELKEGSTVTYNFTVINNGDLEAPHTKLVESYDPQYVEIISASQPYTATGSTLTWDIGSLSPAAATEISYTARIINASGGTHIANTTTVESAVVDYDQTDNSESITLITVRDTKSGTQTRPNKRVESSFNTTYTTLQVMRSAPHTILSPTAYDSLQNLVVTNQAAKDLYQVTLYDELTDENGRILHTETWNLGTVKAREEIKTGYTVSFSEKAPAGVYRLTTYLKTDTYKKAPLARGTITLLSLPSAVSVPVWLPSQAPTSNKSSAGDRLSLPQVLGTTTAEIESFSRDLDYFWGIPTAEANTGSTPPNGRPAKSPSLDFLVLPLTLIGLFTLSFYALLRYRNQRELGL